MISNNVTVYFVYVMLTNYSGEGLSNIISIWLC